MSVRTFCKLLSSLALAGMMVGAQAAYFQTYTAVDGGGAHGAPDQLEFNATGAPLLSTTGAVASTTLLDQYVSAADSTHWTLGPYAATHSDIRFSVAGGGAPATVSFSFEVQGAWDLDLSHSHNATGGFGLELYGLGSDSVSGGFTDVNCIGCGGHIGYSTLSLHGVSTTVYDHWDGVWNGTYTLTTTVESGRPDAGLILVNASTGLGGTHGSLRIRLTSLSLDGQAASLVNNGAAGWSVSAVPEPASYGLALAGLLVVVGLQRRRLVSE
jgi:MYXO-CTERM domain-containing protein